MGRKGWATMGEKMKEDRREEEEGIGRPKRGWKRLLKSHKGR